MPVSNVRKALLDEFGYAMEAYPVDMRPEKNYGPYKVIYLGSAAYNIKDNLEGMKSTQVDLRRWDDLSRLPAPSRDRMEELDRLVSKDSMRSCFGGEKAQEVGLSIGSTSFQLKDLAITNVHAELIPTERYRYIQEAFHRNCLTFVSHEEALSDGQGSRRLYAVVRGTYYATISAIINSDQETRMKALIPGAEILSSGVAVRLDISNEESLMQVAKQSVIGILMTCFRMERVRKTEQEEQWKVSEAIHIGKGRKPRKLKDQLIWTSHTLNRRFLMIWHPERFSYVMVDVGAVLKCDKLDSKTLAEFQDCIPTDDSEEDLSLKNDTEDTALMDESNSTGYTSSFIARPRGGGPEESVDDDGFVMGFDLRSLATRIMGLTLLPVSFEALDHEDFDTVIEWNTVSKRITENGSEAVEITPFELPIETVINAKRPLLEFCIESLEQPQEEKPAGKRKGIPAGAETAMKKTKGESAAATSLERSDSLSAAPSLEATTVTTSAVTTTESMADSVAEVAVADSSADAVLSKAMEKLSFPKR